MKIQIFLLFVFTCFSSIFSQEKKKEWLRDSIPVQYPEENKLNIKKSLTIHNSFRGDFSNVWDNYQNLTTLEAGIFIKDLPIFINVGVEKGNLYTDDYLKPVVNFKIDFNQYLENLKNKFQYSKSINSIEQAIENENLNDVLTKRYNQKLESLEKENLARNLLKKEITNLVGKEVNKKLKKGEIDSIYKKIQFVENYEKMMSDPSFIKSYVNNKKILKEAALGNKIPNVNYDSISKQNSEFDKKSQQYKKLTSDSSFSSFRGKWNQVLSNKDKAFDISNTIKDKYEGRASSFFSKFNLKSLEFKKFNLGQSSVDKNDMVFRGFMVNGINMELKSPMYLNFMYSFPFQTNFISNHQLSNVQNKEVTALGGGIGNNPDKKLHYNVGMYKFVEDIYDREDSTKVSASDAKNIVLTANTKYQLSKVISTRLEFANSKSDRYNVGLLNTSFNFMGNSGVRLGFDFDITKTKSQIQLELQEVGTTFYSAANPFVQKGRGGRVKLKQKIGKKLSLKSIDGYRSYNDTNGLNSILSTNNSLSYKMNRNNRFILRGSYFNSHIEFNNLYTDIINQLYSLSWATRIKALGIKHNLISTLQYLDINSEGSPELNNSTHQRDIQGIINYTTQISKLSLHAYGDYSSSIDSSISRFNNGVQVGYSFSNKTRIGAGYSLGVENSELNSTNITATFTTQVLKKLLLSGSVGYLKNSLLQIERFNPLVRVSYQVF